jgi:hypothetical protein
MKRAAVLIAAALLVSLVGAQEASLDIRFYDKAVYGIDSDVLVRVGIRNIGKAPFRFKLAEDRIHSVDFMVRTLANRALEPSREFIRKRAANQPRFYRELSLEPGEEFSFIERLGDYVAISEAGNYVVTASFFPELAERAALYPPLTSNALSLEIRPSISAPGARSLTSPPSELELLRAEALPPDEVVEYLITARQKAQWNRFFLYIDLESLIQQQPGKEAIYRRESAEGRQLLIERFKEELMKSSDQDIALLPMDFEILRTSYTSTEAEVRVLQRYKYRTFIERKEFTYRLKRMSGVWRVVAYDVTNKGTE